jgi:hypothetical protein
VHAEPGSGNVRPIANTSSASQLGDEGVLLAPQPVRTSRNDPAYALSSSAAGCRGCDESVTFARVLDGYCDTCAEEVLFLRNRALEDRRMPLPPLAKLREHFLPRRRPLL